MPEYVQRLRPPSNSRARAIVRDVYTDEEEKAVQKAQLDWAKAIFEKGSDAKSSDIDKATTILRYMDQQKHGAIAKPEEEKQGTNIYINLRNVNGVDIIAESILSEDGKILDDRYKDLPRRKNPPSEELTEMRRKSVEKARKHRTNKISERKRALAEAAEKRRLKDLEDMNAHIDPIIAEETHGL